MKKNKNLPTTRKYEVKPYHCAKCGFKKQIGTNHFGECYSLGSYNQCPKCPHWNNPTTWICDLPLPKGMAKPEPWKIVKLGDVCKIK